MCDVGCHSLVCKTVLFHVVPTQKFDIIHIGRHRCVWMCSDVPRCQQGCAIHPGAWGLLGWEWDCQNFVCCSHGWDLPGGADHQQWVGWRKTVYKMFHEWSVSMVISQLLPSSCPLSFPSLSLPPSLSSILTALPPTLPGPPDHRRTVFMSQRSHVIMRCGEYQTTVLCPKDRYDNLATVDEQLFHFEATLVRIINYLTCIWLAHIWSCCPSGRTRRSSNRHWHNSEEVWWAWQRLLQPQVEDWKSGLLCGLCQIWWGHLRST